MDRVGYEVIGYLAMDSYIASLVLHKAKLQRRFKRAAFLCKSTLYNARRDDVMYDRCHLSGRPVTEWCENCQTVQPYHIAYIEAAKQARISKFKLTHNCKMLAQRESMEGK